MPTLWRKKLMRVWTHCLYVVELGLVARWLSPQLVSCLWQRSPPEGDGEQL